MLRNLFDDEGIKTFRIDGSVSSDCRASQIKEFEKFHTGCVFIIQIKAGGVGLFPMGLDNTCYYPTFYCHSFSIIGGESGNRRTYITIYFIFSCTHISVNI